MDQNVQSKLRDLELELAEANRIISEQQVVIDTLVSSHVTTNKRLQRMLRRVK